MLPADVNPHHKGTTTMRTDIFPEINRTLSATFATLNDSKTLLVDEIEKVRALLVAIGAHRSGLEDQLAALEKFMSVVSLASLESAALPVRLEAAQPASYKDAAANLERDLKAAIAGDITQFEPLPPERPMPLGIKG